jgi:hypothetical protein
MSPWVIGLHVLSLHSPGTWIDDLGHEVRYNKATNGIYARAANGFTFGAYTNSYDKASAYAGWTWQTENKRWAITAAGVTGYPSKALRFLVLPSVRFDLPADWSLRIGGGPRVEKDGASLVHFALERAW